MDSKGSKEFTIPFNRMVVVKKGDKVKVGDLLSDGPADIKNLFNIAGQEVTRNYILNEVKKVYSTSGESVNDKHIEVIIRQMFSRCKVKDPGDTNFNENKIIERAELIEENERVKELGKKEATAAPLVMPISKVSLSVSGFLAAASFQDTTRVLIKAAIEGKEDKMPRPRLRRRVRGNPRSNYFKPAGIRMVHLKEAVLLPEEFEAIRLIDYQNTEQTKAAEQMQVSQPTLSRILKSAREKISDAIVNGKAIRIYKSK